MWESLHYFGIPFCFTTEKAKTARIFGGIFPLQWSMMITTFKVLAFLEFLNDIWGREGGALTNTTSPHLKRGKRGNSRTSGNCLNYFGESD